jgi:hypothetical protein
MNNSSAIFDFIFSVPNTGVVLCHLRICSKNVFFGRLNSRFSVRVFTSSVKDALSVSSNPMLQLTMVLARGAPVQQGNFLLRLTVISPACEFKD